MTATGAPTAADRVSALSPERRRELCVRLGSHRDVVTPVPDVGPFGLVGDEDRARLPADAVDAYGLGHVQLGMIFHMMSDAAANHESGAPAAYHNVATAHLRISEFSAPAFRRAVELLVRRHEIFRTSLHVVGFSEPLAVVHRARPARLEIIDLRGEPAGRQRQVLACFQREQNGRMVDLTDAPLISFYAHLLDDHHVDLTLVEPHSISDGWSTHLSLVEIIATYEALLAGREPDQRPLSLSYRQFIAEERAAMASPAQRLFWQAYLAGAAATVLPTSEVATPDWTARKSYRAIDPALARRVIDLSRAHGWPLRTILLAAHVNVVGLLAGSDDVLVGVGVNGRLERLDGTEIRGMFLNTLPFRVEGLGTTWRALIENVHAADCLVLPFRRYPLAKILRVVGPHVRPAMLFSHHHFHSVRRMPGGVVDTMESVTDDSRTNVPFEVAVIRSAERDDTLTLLIDADSSRYGPDDVERYARLYVAALTAMTCRLDSPHTPTDAGGRRPGNGDADTGGADRRGLVTAVDAAPASP